MTSAPSKNSLNCYDTLHVGDKSYMFFNLAIAEKTLGDISHLPLSLRILLENMLRHEDDTRITVEDIRTLTALHTLQKNPPQIVFHPSHLIIGDEGGVSALTDIANLATAIEPFLDTPAALASQSPLDIIIAQEPSAIPSNIERYKLLKWGERNFAAVRLVPPLQAGTTGSALASICSSVQVIRSPDGEADIAVPETVLGSQRNIPALCHKGILGWQANTLEVESLILGHPLSFPIPPVLGIKISSKLRKGVGFTDIALTVMLLLRRHDGRGKIIEFFGPGLESLSIGDRAALAQMAHDREGVLATYFPIDAITIAHLTQSKVDPHAIALTESYAKAQGLWRDNTKQEPTFSTMVDLGLDTVRPVVDYDNIVIQLSEVATVFSKNTPQNAGAGDPFAPLRNGDIVVASLGSNAISPHPGEMVAAGLIAREALKSGLTVKPWVRTLMPRLPPSLHAHLAASGLLADLEAIGFSQDSAEEKSTPMTAIPELTIKAVKEKRLTLCALGTDQNLSQEWDPYLYNTTLLTSPALVVIFALAGSIAGDISTKPLGLNKAGKPIALKDILPSGAETTAATEGLPCHILADTHPDNVFSAPNEWRSVSVPEHLQALWEEIAPVIIRPPTVGNYSSLPPIKSNIKNARIWAIWGHEVQAKWIAPDVFKPPAVAPTGNHEKMIERAFKNPALYNAMVDDASAVGLTRHYPSELTMSYADATLRYKAENTPTILLAGNNLGHGWGQEWAAKMLRYCGLSAIIAESYDPAFRLNLIRMGLLPLQFKGNVNLPELNLIGSEILSIVGIPELNQPPGEVMLTIERLEDIERYMLLCRLETPEEFDMYISGSMWALTARAFIV